MSVSDGSPPPLDAPRFEACSDDGESIIVVQASDYDALLARVDDLERERDDWKNAALQDRSLFEAAEAEVTRLTAERDGILFRAEAAEAMRDGAEAEAHHFERLAELRKLREEREAAGVARLQTALSDLVSWLENAGLWSHTDADFLATVEAARAALSGGAAE